MTPSPMGKRYRFDLTADEMGYFLDIFTRGVESEDEDQVALIEKIAAIGVEYEEDIKR